MFTIWQTTATFVVSPGLTVNVSSPLYNRFVKSAGGFLSGFDRYAVGAGQQFQPFGTGLFRGVFAQQAALVVVDVDGLVLQRVVFAGVGCLPGRDRHRHDARAIVAARGGVVFRAGRAEEHREQYGKI